jgi:hypothetical protein
MIFRVCPWFFAFGFAFGSARWRQLSRMTEWWLYFGDIPPSKIVEFTVEEAIPYQASACLTMDRSTQA